ncbi:MAG: GspH/FimT family pseudopilin, partial [Bacteroidota bacterium]|nr:GspH/FimT family pseudopilin [Bacteroidota bacterium]
PNFIQMLPNYRLKDATRTLFSNMQKAKITAVKTNTNCTVTFNQAIGGTTYTYVVYSDSNGNCEFDVGEVVIDQVLWPANQGFGLDNNKPNPGDGGLSFIDDDNGNPSISFQPNSIPTDNNGGTGNGSAFLINSNGWTRSVVVSVAGNISIQ